jgi:uncharacterized membrane protein YkoI
MRARTKAVIAAGVVVAAGAGTAAAVGAGGDTDKPIQKRSDRQKAEEAAVRYVGEGRATETEEGDEESYYEVEVRRDDGSQVDVQLDRRFNVVGSSEDEEDSGETADGD